MSQLTGFPFPVGVANVYRVDRQTGAVEIFASGFTNIMDLAFDEDGTLWVLEIDHDSLGDHRGRAATARSSRSTKTVKGSSSS